MPSLWTLLCQWGAASKGTKGWRCRNGPSRTRCRARSGAGPVRPGRGCSARPTMLQARWVGGGIHLGCSAGLEGTTDAPSSRLRYTLFFGSQGFRVTENRVETSNEISFDLNQLFIGRANWNPACFNNIVFGNGSIEDSRGLVCEQLLLHTYSHGRAIEKCKHQMRWQHPHTESGVRERKERWTWQAYAD